MYRNIAIFMYLMGLFSYTMNRKHLLLMLLSLEFVVVSLFLGLYICLYLYNWEFYFLMVFFGYKCMWSGFSIIYSCFVDTDMWK